MKVDLLPWKQMEALMKVDGSFRQVDGGTSICFRGRFHLPPPTTVLAPTSVEVGGSFHGGSRRIFSWKYTKRTNNVRACLKYCCWLVYYCCCVLLMVALGSSVYHRRPFLYSLSVIGDLENDNSRTAEHHFFSFFSSHLLSSPFFSPSRLVVTQIRGHLAGSSPPSPLLAFLSREDFNPFFFPRRLASNCA